MISVEFSRIIDYIITYLSKNFEIFNDYLHCILRRGYTRVREGWMHERYDIGLNDALARKYSKGGKPETATSSSDRFCNNSHTG